MSSEAPFSFTTKVNGDLLTVRGDDFESFINNTGRLINVPQISALLSVIEGEAQLPVEIEQAAVAVAQQALGGHIVSAPAVVPQTAAVPQQVFAPVAPPQAAVAPPVAGPTCAHGPMKLVAGGISKKTGKPYNAFWACQWPERDQQCKAVSTQ